MEIEKVIRIVCLFLFAAALAVYVASRLLFPDSPPPLMPILILLLSSLGGVWNKTRKKEHSNK